MTSTIKSDRPTRITVNATASLTASLCVVCIDPSGACRADFYGRASADIAGNTVLFTLPSECRPRFSFGGIAVITTSNGSALAGQVTLDADGKIYMPNLSSTSRGIVGHIEYYL